MERLLRDKDYDQIEAACNLYAVMREERLLERAEFMIGKHNELTKLTTADEQTKQQLQEVRARRQELEKKVGLEDSGICASIAHVLQDDLITVFDKAGADQIKKVASVFENLTEEEAASIETRNRELTSEVLDSSSVIADLEAQGFDR